MTSEHVIDKNSEPYLITYRHKDSTACFQQWSNSPIPVWARDIQKVMTPTITELERVIARNTFEVENADTYVLSDLFKTNIDLLKAQEKDIITLRTALAQAIIYMPIDAMGVEGKFTEIRAMLKQVLDDTQ